nr:MAG TPA: hypothetical protein [Caudoviricetes sp.]
MYPSVSLVTFYECKDISLLGYIVVFSFYFISKRIFRNSINKGI